MNRKSLALTVFVVAAIMFAAYAATDSRFIATDHTWPSSTPSNQAEFRRSGFFMNDDNNTVRFYDGQDSVNMGGGTDIWNMSTGSDVLAFAGPSDIISFELGNGSPAGPNAYANSEHYLKSYDTETSAAKLELRSNNVAITANTGDVIIKLGP